MTMFDAGASVKHHHARRTLAAVAIGLGALIGSAGVASARPPLRAWVPQPQPKPAFFTDWRQAADLLPVSMVHERNAMLGDAEEARLVFVPQGGVQLDSATLSLLAKAKAAQVQQRIVDARPEHRPDSKDHPGYGSSTARVDRPDTKDHPLYPGSPNYVAERPDTKDHPRYGATKTTRRVVSTRVIAV